MTDARRARPVAAHGGRARGARPARRPPRGRRRLRPAAASFGLMTEAGSARHRRRVPGSRRSRRRARRRAGGRRGLRRGRRRGPAAARTARPTSSSFFQQPPPRARPARMRDGARRGSARAAPRRPAVRVRADRRGRLLRARPAGRRRDRGAPPRLRGAPGRPRTGFEQVEERELPPPDPAFPDYEAFRDARRQRRRRRAAARSTRSMPSSAPASRRRAAERTTAGRSRARRASTSSDARSGRRQADEASRQPAGASVIGTQQ